MYGINAGLTEGEFVAVVASSDFAYEFATENGRDRSSRLESRLSKVWAKAEDDWNPPIGSVEEVRHKLEALSQRVEAHKWSGRTSSTDRAVALAIVAWAHEIGVWTIGANVRDLSVRASVARETARRALTRLAALGLLRRDTADRDGDNSQRWVIRLGWGISYITRPYEPLPPGEKPYGLTTSLNHPAFVRAGLGQTSERVWLDLVNHPDATVREIADRTGVSVAAVRRTLDTKLVPNQLAKESGTRSAGKGRPSVTYQVVVSDQRQLDLIADEFGVIDWHERTADRYDRERAGYRAAREIRNQERQQAEGADL
jgi:predicted ArsR family transcriptional regulator